MLTLNMHKDDHILSKVSILDRTSLKLMKCKRYVMHYLLNVHGVIELDDQFQLHANLEKEIENYLCMSLLHSNPYARSHTLYVVILFYIYLYNRV